MNKKDLINSFLSSSAIAVAGVSRDKRKFGHTVFNELKQKGYNVIPVNPNLSEINGLKVYSHLNEIPFKTDAVLTVVKPEQTEAMISELRKDDVKIIWMQPGSESDKAVEMCKAAGIEVITGECILLYTNPNGVHKVHRFFRQIFGKMPA